MTRNAAEDHAIGRIDRQRGKAKTTARTLQVRDTARTAVNAAVMAQPEEDRAEFMRASICHLRTLYGAGEGQAEAVALFGSLAWSGDLQIGKAVAVARAEQVFALRNYGASTEAEICPPPSPRPPLTGPVEKVRFPS
jgi:hypothetical protein